VNPRRVVVFALTDHLRTELALETLALAHVQRHPPPGTLIHCSDRCCQYMAQAY
jgi:putative transposase